MVGMAAKVQMILLLFSLTSVLKGQQLQQPGLSIANEVLHLDDDRKGTLKKLDLCCSTIPLGKDAVVVSDKKDFNHILGTVYFETDKVSGIATDRKWSPELASYEVGLTFLSRCRSTDARDTNTSYGLHQ